MSGHSARPRGRERYRTLDRFAATTAESLTDLKFSATLIAEHGLLRPYSPYASFEDTTFLRSSFQSSGENEKATRQKAASSQGRIVPTEVKNRQNFLAKSYGPKTRVSRNFFGN